MSKDKANPSSRTVVERALYPGVPKSLRQRLDEQVKITDNLAAIFLLTELDASKKFGKWLLQHPFTAKEGYKKILAGDYSFLDY